MARRLKQFTSAWDDSPRAEMPRKAMVSKYRSKPLAVGSLGLALLDALKANGREVRR